VSQSSWLKPLRFNPPFPLVESQPLCPCVTFWQGTAPVKLPSKHFSRTCFQRPKVSLTFSNEWYYILCLAAPTYSRQSKNMKAMSTCSKAPRGLFVHVEVGRVFTAIAISPSKPSRQLLARYAIHAGQNLPGKELRYLRTVHFLLATIFEFT
jgi:hypothetical protein